MSSLECLRKVKPSSSDAVRTSVIEVFVAGKEYRMYLCAGRISMANLLS